MSIRRLIEVVSVAFAFYVLTVSPAAAACCDDLQKACCQAAKATCCGTVNDPVAEAVLIPQVSTPHPVREALVVWFKRPMKVGNQILQGKYVIEHDNDRMARGEPCTFIYSASDRRVPVAAFHCEHLDRPRGERASVTARPVVEGNGMQELREFQFAGELGAHGVPGAR